MFSHQKISEVRIHQGVPTLFINNKPTFAMIYQSFPPRQKTIREFKNVGADYCTIRVQSGWIGEGKYDYEDMDEAVSVVLEANPQALILLRIYVDAPEWWCETYTAELQMYDDGTLEKQSMASELWRKETSAALINFTRHIKSSSYNEHIFGYHLAGGRAQEWNYYGSQRQNFMDFSKPMRQAFGRWLQERFHGDIAKLRKIWNNPEIDFDSVPIPSPAERVNTSLGVFRDPQSEGNVIEYFRFLSWLMADVVIHFCKAVKEATEYDRICGVFYGYTVGWPWCPYTYQHSGHLALKRVVDSPWVDFLTSPNMYENRHVGGHAPAMSPLDSVKSHGKLWFAEADTRTVFAPANHDVWGRPITLSDSLAILKRDFANVLITGTDMWWSTGKEGKWLSHPEILELMAKMKKVGDESLDCDRSSVARIAVLVSEKSFFYQWMENSLVWPLIYRQIQCELGKIGAPYDIYLMSDLEDEKLDQYKVYIFLNAFYLTSQERKLVKSRLQGEGKVLLWIYAPGFVDEDGLSTERMKELTGIELAYEDVLTKLRLDITDCDHPYTQNSQHFTAGLFQGYFGTDRPIRPHFYSTDKDVVVLGKLSYNHRPGFVVKEFPDWTSIYVAAPDIPAGILRNIAREAGVHIYNDEDDVFYANGSYLCVHTKYGGERTLHLPHKCDVYDALSRTKVAEGVESFSCEYPERSSTIYKLR